MYLIKIIREQAISVEYFGQNQRDAALKTNKSITICILKFQLWSSYLLSQQRKFT